MPRVLVYLLTFGVTWIAWFLVMGLTNLSTVCFSYLFSLENFSLVTWSYSTCSINFEFLTVRSPMVLLDYFSLSKLDFSRAAIFSLSFLFSSLMALPDCLRSLTCYSRFFPYLTTSVHFSDLRTRIHFWKKMICRNFCLLPLFKISSILAICLCFLDNV